MASPWLEKRQRMCSSGPCERQFNLLREERFNKGARATIHRDRLLPVLSDGWIEIPCYLFRMLWRMSLYCGGDCRAAGGEDFIGGATAGSTHSCIMTRPPTLGRSVSATRSRLTSPSYSSPSTLRWEQIAGRGRRRQVCEKRTLLISILNFAVNSISIPVIW